MSKLPKHILVIRLSAMGDIAITVPIIRAFTQQYPKVKLSILTKPFFKPFFNSIPNVTVFNANVKGTHKGVFGLWKLSRELHKIDIDAVADLHNVLRSNMLKCFLNLPVKTINKGRKEKKALVNGKEFKQLKTTHQRYADVFKALGFPLNLNHPNFPKKKTVTNSVKQLLGQKTKTWIGIAPFAAFKSKMYPLDLMEQVIAKLNKNYKVILFGGGTNEITTLNNIAAKYNNVISIAGQFNLQTELDIITNLDVMLSMDSGNAHIAAMLGVKTITLWGATHPYAGFYPFNMPKDYALLANREKFPLIPTSIYGNKVPTKAYTTCMETISPNSVYKKIIAVVE